MASHVFLQQPILTKPPDIYSSYANHFPMPTYWDSTEAQLLFNPTKNSKQSDKVVNEWGNEWPSTQKIVSACLSTCTSIKHDGNFEELRCMLQSGVLRIKTTKCSQYHSQNQILMQALTWTFCWVAVWYIHATLLPIMIRESTAAVPTDSQYISDVDLLFESMN